MIELNKQTEGHSSCNNMVLQRQEIHSLKYVTLVTEAPAHVGNTYTLLIVVVM